MRLDKFLKLSRIIKRRVIAKQMADIGAVRLNNKNANPDTEVKKGDHLEIAFPRKVVSYEVLEVDETLLKRGAAAFLVDRECPVTPGEKPW